MKKDEYHYKRIAYLGIPGSYSYIISEKYFGKKMDMISQNTITDIFQNVAEDNCLFGIIPLENSTTGSILESFDQLISSDLSIIGEAVLHIHHNLLVNNGKTFDIKKCYSHPQAIAQCRKFFKEHHWIVPVLASDTASGAKYMKQKKGKGTAAIASLSAAKIYDLKILARNIEDHPNNYTRFVIIGKTQKIEGNKVSLVFSVEHKPGSLFRTLEPYARFGLNLTKIESRPVFGRPWEYIFFIDFEINGKLRPLHEILAKMKENVNFLKILGRYQKGKIYES